MDNNLYNQLSKEISLNLPDINFDSDSEENSSLNGESVKPYIRPPAEILFGNEDLTENEKELLEMFTKLPVDTEMNEELSPRQSSSKGCNTDDLKDLNDENKNLETNFEKKANLPYQNIQLSNGLRTHEASETKFELAKFGTIDDLDIDKALEELDLSDDKCTFFDDVLSEIENHKRTGDDINNGGKTVSPDNDYIEKSDSELLKRLDEMAAKYEFKSSSDKAAIKHADVKKDVALSLSNLLVQCKNESSSDMVFLDLRSQNEAWNCQNNNHNSSNNDSIKRLTAILESETSDGDNDSNDENGKDVKNELWIAQYRRMKNESASTNTKIEEATKSNNQRTNYRNFKSKYCSQKRKDENVDSKNNNKDDDNNIEITDSALIESDKPIKTPSFITDVSEDNEISKSIRLKIENVKQIEKQLSERRELIKRLHQCLDPFESTPLLLHEEVTFNSNSYSLLPDLDTKPSNENILVHCSISFEPPCTLLTTSRLSGSIDDRVHSSFTHILHLLLSPTLSIKHLQMITRSLQITAAHIHFVASTKLSITKLRAYLKSVSLKSVYENVTSLNTSFLNQMPLSNIIKIVPYNELEFANLWKWNSSSIGWMNIKSSDGHIHRGPNSFIQHTNIDNSCVIVQSNFYEEFNKFIPFLTKILQHLYIAGLRLIYKGDIPKLVFVVRGYGAVEYMKHLSSNWSYKPYVNCTRFQESFAKEAADYFGPRFNQIQLTNQLLHNDDLTVARQLKTNNSNISSTLFHLPITYELLLISPHVLDVGWIINKIYDSCGLVTINNWRIKLNSEQKQRLLFDENSVMTNDHADQSDNDSHHVTNVLQVMQEATSHIINYAMEACKEFIITRDSTNSNKVSVDHIFCHSPYNSETIEILNLKTDNQLPAPREPIKSLPRAPYPDCEQFSFVLLISACPHALTTSLIPQVYDMTSNLDLLSMKLFLSNYSSLPAEHLDLLLTVFDLKSSVQLIPQPISCAVFVFRSMFLHNELEKIQSSLKQQSNLVFAYTLDVEHTFRLMGSFFTSSELVSDPRRRIIFQFMPQSIIEQCKSQKLIGQLELTYKPIKSAFKIIFQSNDNICHKLKRYWFLLTREGFIITDVACNMYGSREFLLVTSRPNAVFMLQQWANNFYTQDDKPASLELLENPDGLDVFEELITSTKLEVQRLLMNPPAENSQKRDSVIVCIHEDLLVSSVESMTKLKCLWNFIDDNSYVAKSVFISLIDGAVEYKLFDKEKICDLKGEKITHGRYLILTLEAPMINVVFKDLFLSKCQILNIDEYFLKKIFIITQANSCFNFLLKIDETCA